MRFWSWIPLFFLLQYSVCGQKDPSFDVETIPASLDILAQVVEGEEVFDIYDVSLFIDDELQSSPPLTVELDSGVEYRIRIEKDAWSFDPAEQTLTLGPLENREIRFVGRSDEPRLALVEDFSNHGCDPCPAADEAMWEAVEASADLGQAVPIAFHVNFPRPGDPFYLYAPFGQQMNFARSGPDFYFVTGVPHIRVDGEPVSTPSSSEEIQGFIEARLTRSRALSLSLERIQTESEVTVNVSGTVHRHPNYEDGWRLYVVLYETLVHYDAPNEQTEFRNSVRHVNGEESGTLGVPVSLTPSASFQTSVTFAPTFGANSPAEVDPENIRALAFVQLDHEPFEVLDLVVEENGGP